MKTKRTLSNIIFGFGTQLIVICLGMILPRLVLLTYGSDTNGFTSVVTQFFTYMTLLEAGIGQSTLNSLYEPIANNDRDAVSRRMSASTRYYRKVTKIYAVLVICFAFIIPLVVKTNISLKTAFFYIFFSGMSSVIGFYYLEAWKQLLSADGKYYVTQIIGMIITVASYVLKIILVPLAIKISYIQLGYFLIALVQLLIYKIYLKKNYGWVDFNAKPDNIALKDRYAFMITQVAATIFTSTDMIVLSVLGSTLLSSVYSIYGLIFNNLTKILSAIYFGTVFLLGQLWQKNRNEYLYAHDLFDIITHWAVTATMSVACLLAIPFVRLYTSGVNDTNYVYEWLPLLFGGIQILSFNRYVNGNLTALAGYAKEVSKISAIEAIANLSLSIILGIKYGIYGVLFATIIVLPLKIIYCTNVANNKILKRKCAKSVLIILLNDMLFVMTYVITKFIKIEMRYTKK